MTVTWTSFAHDIIDITEQIRSNSTMVGIGHSFGASSLLIAQLLRPDIFDAIFAVEPVLAFAEGFHGHKYELTLRRRAVWNSKAHAIKYFTKHPFFATWDPRVLQIFLRHGLSPATTASQTTKAEGKGNETVAITTASAATTTTAVQLKCQPRDEYETYMGGWVDSVRTIDNMSEIICPTRFLLGELSSVCPNSKYAQSYASSCLLSDARVAKDLGHLIPMESPETVAHQLGLFLSDRLVLNTGLQFRSRL
ncbi:hypothetical protein IWQ60_004408 [Tieghemiomyces parasiticus]|uniref:AB hydrolase-1 domain-containing protein n=1 Tax=Tieghemiomyces parasiticus TaxID=78921 RepID=A0A9W8AAZ8_9FUNG|nr:hypothetical protein IWQ60_004408 [Tieghemiomyces parasiticus]